MNALKKIAFLLVLFHGINISVAQETWNTLLYQNDFNSSDIYGLNDSILYVVGSNGMDPNVCYAYKSTDYGMNWSNLSFDIYVSDGIHVYFSHPDTGFVVGFFTQVVKTVNGGLNWTDVSPTFTSSYYAAQFIDSNIGYVGDWDGNIIKTADGGESWTFQNSGISTVINSIFFLDKNTGFATSENGAILKTVNGGDNWEQLSSGVSSNLGDIYFVNENIGFIIGHYNNTILKTTDGGSSWVSQNSNTLNGLSGIKMIDAVKGYIVGENSTILKTYNGGENWITVNNNISSSLNDLEISNNNIYVTGDEYVYGAHILNPVNNLEWDHWYIMPNNYFSLTWNAPNISQDTLIGYNIYRDNELYRFQMDTVLNMLEDGSGNCDLGFLEFGGQFWIHVTAVYNSTNSESDYADSAFCQGLLINVESLNQPNISLYPNPANDFIIVHTSDKGIRYTYSIFDSANREIIKGIADDNNNLINLQKIENGIYIIKFENNFGEVYTQKIIKY